MENCERDPADVEATVAPSAADPAIVGPIPWTWIRAAYDIQPACLIVALALWYGHAKANRAGFQMSMKVLADAVGLSHRTVQRVVSAMHQAGMIDIQCRPGLSHVFVINEDLDGLAG